MSNLEVGRIVHIIFNNHQYGQLCFIYIPTSTSEMQENSINYVQVFLKKRHLTKHNHNTLPF